MKKSLITRWLIIAIVVLGWSWAMFPIKDKDFLEEFNRSTRKQVARLEARAAGQEGDAAAVKAKLDALQDKQSQEAKQLSELYQAKLKLEDFQELQTRISTALEADQSLSKFKAVEQAARGNADTYRIALNDYVDFAVGKKISNKLILQKLRRNSAGRLHLGLDLQGGTEFVVSFDKDQVPAEDNILSIRDSIVEILRNRVDSMGVAEPDIKALSENSISIKMPSVDEADKTSIRETIRQSAKLTFHLVAQDNETLVSQYEADRKGFKTPANLLRSEILVGDEDNETTAVIFIHKDPEPIQGGDVKQARPSFNEFGNYSISMEFNGRGAQAFGEVTGRSVGRRLAICLDGRIYSAPNIREAINGGRAEITGSFTPEEAKRLAGVIASGNLPVSIDITSEFGTDPTLGADSVKSGAFAGLLGLVLVVLFMLWYYKFAGLVADIALVVNALLVFGTMALTKATITMPGLAGMVLTIGMAVDANVLIFERIREELRSGKTLANAIAAGYGRAFWCIFDSNLTTLITCFFLYKFGTGSVKGFAVTLSFGILASMFTALFMTHAIFDFMVEKGWLKTLDMHSFKTFLNPNFNFVKAMKPAMWLSLCFVVISLLTMVVRGRSLLGIDFTGGTQFTYDCQGANPDVEKIRGYLQQLGYEETKVGYKRGQGGEEQLDITLPGTISEDANVFSDKLDAAFPECQIKLSSTYAVGGSVGSQFRNAAILAFFVSFLAVIIYLSFRFEFHYGLAAVVAVIHDVVVSAGMFFLLQRGQLSLTVVAALMTIVGYSLNDTIVIFDRIRETQGLFHGRTTLLYPQLISQSINQTISRTMLTTLTTMLVVIALVIFGGGVIFDFSIVMLYGMISGTYSSTFMAGALINAWHKPTAAEQKLLASQGAAADKA